MLCTYGWSFYVINYASENSFLISFYVYFVVVLEFPWFIQKKESVNFYFFFRGGGGNFLAPKTSQACNKLTCIKWNWNYVQVQYIQDKIPGRYFSASLTKVRQLQN